VRLRSDRLRALAEQAGVDRDALAAAVDRTGLSGESARRAVDNWLAGRDHPRCKAKDIARLAEAVGARVTDISRFVSEVRYHRGSTQKARLVADLIRGKHIDEAKNLLLFSPKRAAVNVHKCLDAAIADAQEFEADEVSLYVAECRIDEGPPIKRFRPKDRGRAHPILKQTSHITVGVQERS